MKKLKIYIVLISALSSVPFIIQPVAAGDAAPKILLSPSKPGPGEIVIVTVKGTSGRVEGKFIDKRIHFFSSTDSVKGVFGVDLYTEPGEYKLDLTVDGHALSRTVTVKEKKYPVQRLTLPKDMVELSPENEARADREQKKVAAIWPAESERVWSGNFINPREGEISTKFGLRRIINGISKNPHSGVDVAADEGTDVYAPNDAVVAMVDDHFFSGNSVILNHGLGLYTMFFHLSKVLVKEGQQVKKGEVIALVGSTGRSTGAHLHWGVRMQGARVDPLTLIKLKLE